MVLKSLYFFLKHLLQELPGITFRYRCHLFRSTGCHDLATGISSLRTDVYEVIGRLDHVEVVFDHDDGIAFLYEVVEHFDQFFGIVKMEPGCRLIEQVQVSFLSPSLRVPWSVDPLCLAS